MTTLNPAVVGETWRLVWCLSALGVVNRGEV